MPRCTAVFLSPSTFVFQPCKAFFGDSALNIGFLRQNGLYFVSCSVLNCGCDDLVALHKSGQLQLKLEHALADNGSHTDGTISSANVKGTASVNPSAVDLHLRKPLRSFFWFPDAVDNR